MPHWPLFLLFGAAIFFASGIGGLEYLAHTNVDPGIRANIEIERSHLDAYLSDLEFLKNQPLLVFKKTGQSDAGPYLNPRLAWAPTIAGQESTRELIPEKMREKILRYRGDWMRQYPRVELDSVDLSWLSELSKFDHWDLESAGPIHELLKKSAFIPPGHLPNPDTLDIETFIKIRLMKGARDSQALKALTEVRKFAELSLTTESIYQQINGLAILGIERRAYRFYVEHSLLNATDWTLVDQNFTRRANRAIWATRGYLRLWTPADILQKVFLDESRMPIGICAAINEELPNDFAVESMLDSYWPFERDYREKYAALNKLLERGKTVCRLAYLQKMIEAHAFHPPHLIIGPFMHLPYARKLFGLKLVSGRFSGFDGYTANAKPDGADQR